MFEDLAMDVFDEVERRESNTSKKKNRFRVWYAWWFYIAWHAQVDKALIPLHVVPFLPVNPAFSATRNQVWENSFSSQKKISGRLISQPQAFIKHQHTYLSFSNDCCLRLFVFDNWCFNRSKLSWVFSIQNCLVLMNSLILIYDKSFTQSFEHIEYVCIVVSDCYFTIYWSLPLPTLGMHSSFFNKFSSQPSLCCMRIEESVSAWAKLQSGESHYFKNILVNNNLDWIPSLLSPPLHSSIK